MSEENGNKRKTTTTIAVPVDLREILGQLAEDAGVSIGVVTEILLRKVLTPERADDTPEARVQRALEAWQVR